MLNAKVLLAALVGMLFVACKGDKKESEVEVRQEISEKLEESGLYKQSSNSDETIAAMNVIYKTPYESLKEDNKATLEKWNKAIDYNGAKDLYDDMFASFNMSEQVASLIEEYSDKEYDSVHERDVFNQTVSLLFHKEEDSSQYKRIVNTFKEIYEVTSKELQSQNMSVDIKSWNKGMSKNFTEYWHVHSSRILEADAIAQTTTLKEFLNREAS